MERIDEIQKYIDEWKNIYINFHLLLDCPDFNEQQLQDFLEIIKKTKYEDNHEEYQHILLLLINTYNNYHGKNLLQKITQIIIQLKDSIKQTFSNIEIFNIFKSNKAIILFLLEINLISIDENIYNEILNTYESKETPYFYYFYPEIKSFIDEKIRKEIEDELIEINPNIFQDFNEKRKEGQNDSYICSLIRQDSIDEFVIYVNQTNLSLSSQINQSIFETNQFLIENNPNLIEYAAFFGSIEIFQYLKLNNIQLTSSLWLYAIHSNNAELIQILEDNNVDPPNNSYEDCLIEAIKCHHNDIANYIKNNHLLNNISNDSDLQYKNEDDFISSIFKYQNYYFFPNSFNDSDEFFYLCFYQYSYLVDIFIKLKEDEIKSKII